MTAAASVAAAVGCGPAIWRASSLDCVDEMLRPIARLAEDIERILRTRV
ncbi:hypothetical protein [Streptomyces echinatus]|uniref:Uncharacterized protein n=1 Tax=Streptomyces echinatus TaxID=67293 RepID=A0A7W9UW11_9ACTN|nr:hypothetical protein [Streptomyces echinatus]MBB5932204.1 hypothetical protein [Streptomyces echinatus]